MDLKNSQITVFENVKKECEFSFAKHTTYGCGGTAKNAYYPETLEQAAVVYDCLKKNGSKYVLIVNG